MLSSLPQHAFVQVSDPPGILVSMVQRTREHVRRLDSMNYRRMHNFLMGASSEDDDTKEESEGTD